MSVRNLNPISKETLQDQAYEQLKRKLMEGMFAPGASVTLRGLAAELGTSVMPIRVAVRRLVSDDVLEMPTSRKVRVPLLDAERLENVLQLRILLEGEAAARASAFADGSDVKGLREVNERLSSSMRNWHARDFFAYNYEFHFGVYRLARDPLLVSMIEKLWLLSGPYLTLLTDQLATMRGPGLARLAAHQTLLKALRSRDAAAARKAIASDILEAAALYRRRLPGASARAAAVSAADQAHDEIDTHLR